MARVTRFGAAGGEAGRANVAVFLLNLGESITTTLVAAYLGWQGYPLSSIGLLVGVFAVASLLSRVPAGQMANRPSARRWYAAACVVVVGSLACYPLAPNAPLFLAVRLAHGFFAGFVGTLNFAAFLGVATGRNRLQATAYYTAFMSAGYAIGNLVAGVVADHFGYAAAFWVAAACPALAMMAAPRSVPDVVLKEQEPRQAGVRLSRILLRPEVMAVPLLAFAINFTHQTLGTLFPLYALSIGHSLTLVGVARSLQSLSNTVIRPFGGGLLRMMGLFGLACSGLLLQGLGVAAVAVVSAPAIISALFVVIGMGRGFATVANALSTSQITSRGTLNRGAASTLASIGGDSAAIMAPVMCGFMAASVGVGSAMQVMAVLATVIGVLVMIGARRGLADEGVPG